MAKTLSQILIDAGAVVDLEAAEPTGDELTLRSNYANQAVWDAVVTGQLSELTQEYVRSISGVTVPLPSNFYEFKLDPHVLDSTGNWTEFTEIDVKDKYEYNSGDRVVYVLGNPVEGYNAVLSQNLSGSTFSVLLQRYPTGMQTLADKCELSDPTYVSRAVEAYVLYSRGDDRFPIAENKKNTQLQNMYSREMKTPGGQARTTQANFKNPLR